MKKEPFDPFEPHWPEGLVPGESYKVLCDDKGRNGRTWLRIFVSEADGDVHVSMQEWEYPDIDPMPSPFPSIRSRTIFGGGKNHRTHQALKWLARAIQLDNEENHR